MDMSKFTWTREPKQYTVNKDTIEITTKPHTDLWQRTYYHFRNDNAPVFQMETSEKYFSFTVKTEFQESGHRFDQCGIDLPYVLGRRENTVRHLCMFAGGFLFPGVIFQPGDDRMPVEGP